MYESFLDRAGLHLRGFIEDNDDFLRENGFSRQIKEAKNGYVVSYAHKVDKKQRTILNYVFRKPGMFVRLYADHAGYYEEYLESLPDTMQAAMKKASDCKRLKDPTQCSSHCRMGMDYTLAGERLKKCRYGAFLFPVGQEEIPFIKGLIEREVTVTVNE